MSRNHRDGPAISEHARSECRRLRTSNYIPFSTGVRALSVRFDPTEGQALGQQRGVDFFFERNLAHDGAAGNDFSRGEGGNR